MWWIDTDDAVRIYARCSMRALARAGVPRPPGRWLITCELRATGLVSNPGKR